MLGLATTLLSPAMAMADSQDGTSSDVKELEPVRVTENTQTRKDLDPNSLTNPFRVEESSQVGTEVFTKEDIQNLMPKDLNDLLDKAMGLNVTYQGRKSPYFMTERGGGTFTYILDGAVLPPSNNRILYAIPMNSIEQVEVVRGATTLTLGPSIPIGSSASGSGLNTAYVIINTKQPERTELDLMYSAEKGTEGFPLSQTDSIFAGTVLDLSPSVKNYVGGMISEMERPSIDSWFDGQRYTAQMGTMGFKTKKLTINLMAMRDSAALEMQRGVKTDGTLDTSKWYYDPLITTVLTGDMTMEWVPEQVTIFNLFSTRYQQTEHDDSFTSATTTAAKYYEEKTSGLGLRHNARFGGTLIQVGAQASKCTGLGPNTSQSYNNFNTDVTGWAGSVQQDLFSKRLVLDGGFRQDIKRIDYSASSAAKLKADNNVDMAPTNVFATGAHWAITKMFDFDGRYLNGHEGLVGDFDMRAQKGILHPESQDRVELTLTAKPCEYVKPAITWFNVKMDNAKTATTTTYVTDTGTYYYYTEADQLRRGIELSVSGSVQDWGSSYKLGWTHMLNIESTSNGTTTDSIGISDPRNLLTVILSQKWNGFTANLSIKTVSDWENTSSAMGLATTGGLGGYTRVDFNIQKDFHLLNHRANVTIYARNLTDEQYATRYVTGYYYDRGTVIGTQVTLEY